MRFRLSSIRILIGAIVIVTVMGVALMALIQGGLVRATPPLSK